MEGRMTKSTKALLFFYTLFTARPWLVLLECLAALLATPFFVAYTGLDIVFGGSASAEQRVDDVFKMWGVWWKFIHPLRLVVAAPFLLLVRFCNIPKRRLRKAIAARGVDPDKREPTDPKAGYMQPPEE